MPQTLKFKREFSAGGIVLRPIQQVQGRPEPKPNGRQGFDGELSRTAQDKSLNNKWEVLLIHNMAMRDPNKSYWGFPKGHIDKGESSKDAAVREVKEEVGLDVEILEKIGESKYIFTKNKEKIFKVVVMFLMKAKSGEIKILEDELLGADWFSTEEALEKLSFKQDKELLNRALKELINR